LQILHIENPLLTKRSLEAMKKYSIFQLIKQRPGE